MKIEQKNLFIIIGLVAVSLALLFLGICPTVKDMNEDNKQIQSEKSAMAELLDQGNSITKNKQNLIKVENEIDALDKSVLVYGEELAFITDLEERAKDNNLTQNINFDNETDDTVSDGKLKEIPLYLEINGTLRDIIRYINSLESLDYYIDINTINIASDDTHNLKRSSNQIIEEDDNNSQNESVLSVKIGAFTYWR